MVVMFYGKINSITGDGRTSTVPYQIVGIHWDPTGTVYSTTGAITITGYANNNGQNDTAGLWIQGHLGSSSNESGNITLQADNFFFDVNTNPAPYVISTGTLELLTSNTHGISIAAGSVSGPSSNSFANGTTQPFTLYTNWFNSSSTYITNSFSSIQIGSTTEIGGLTVSSPLTLGTSLLLENAGNININAAISDAANKTLTLTGGSGSTVSGSGNISATNLLLNGAGTTYNLNTATANSVGTLAATGVAGLSFTNSTALNIGTIGSTNGVSASGSVSIATSSGNLTVAQSVETTNTTSSALVLDAGKLDAVSTTVDNIVLSGSPAVTVGSGGRATLYTGSVSNSTGVTALVGSGSGDFRYDSNAGTSNFTAALGASGIDAVYREQPTLTITANSPSAITYGSAAPAYTNSVTGVNGDTSSQALSTQATVAVGGAVSTSGNLTAATHTLTPSGAVGQLGYALSYVNGSIVINPLAITVSATAANKVYDGSTSATASLTNSGVIAGDTINFANTSANFANKNVGTGITVTVSGISASGTDSGNYTLNSTSAMTTANITQLSSVTWIGGTSGNWFNPANWAGGAVPDLSNVANVVIPSGDTVNFNSGSFVAPAQTGTVNLTNIGSSGSLNMIAGALNVSNSVQLNNFGVSGGTLGGMGNVAVNSFNQSGGTVSNGGNLTVSQSLTQSGGTINVGGNVAITQTTGAVTLGNISTGGNLSVTASSGAVSQSGPLSVTGKTNIAAGGNNVILAYAGNNLGGDVSVTGNNVSISDAGGDLVIGTIASTGNLNLSATGGALTQANGGTISVAGTTDLSAAANSIPTDITVGNQGNNFGGTMTASGHNMTENNSGGMLTLGNTTSTGSLTVSSNEAIAQQSGTQINSTDYAKFTSASGQVLVVVAGNSFSGGSNLVSSSVVVPPPPIVPLNVTLPTPGINPPPLQTVVDSAGNSGANNVKIDSTISNVNLGASVSDSSSGGTSSAGEPNVVGNGAVSVSMVRQPSIDESGIITVSVPKEMATAGSGFSFPLPEQIVNSSSERNSAITVATMTGQSLPNWLKFDPDKKTFTAAAVPDGAFPMQVKVTVNGKISVILISERKE